MKRENTPGRKNRLLTFLAAVVILVSMGGRDARAASKNHFTYGNWETLYYTYIHDGDLFDALNSLDIALLYSIGFDEGKQEMEDWHEIFETDDPFYMEYRRPARIGLCDMDGNGIPELLVDSGGDFALGDVHVFTVWGNQVQYAGAMFYHEYLYWDRSEWKPGIYVTSGNMGYFPTYYYAVKNGKLECTDVCAEIYPGAEGEDEEYWDEEYWDEEYWDEEAEDGEPGWNVTTGEPGVQVTYEPEIEIYDEDLYQALRYPGNPPGIVMTRLEDILSERIGWNNFSEMAEQADPALVALPDQLAYAAYAPDLSNVIGYSYLSGFDGNWETILRAIDVLSWRFDSLDESDNRRRFYFTLALEMSTIGAKKAQFFSPEDPPKELKLINSELKLVSADYAQSVLDMCDPTVTASLRLHSNDIMGYMKDTFSGKMDSAEFSTHLALLGMDSDGIDEVLETMDIVGSINFISKAADVEKNIRKGWQAIAKIINQRSLLNSLNKRRMRMIASAYIKSDRPEMRQVGRELELFVNGDEATQITMLVQNELSEYGLDIAYSIASSALMKEIAAGAGAGVAAGAGLAYAAIDYVTGSKAVNESYYNLIFAVEAMKAFWDGLQLAKDKAWRDGSAENIADLVCAVINYYSSAANVDRMYRAVVETGDKQLISHFLNNDAMRNESSQGLAEAMRFETIAKKAWQYYRYSIFYLPESRVFTGEPGGGGGGW